MLNVEFRKAPPAPAPREALFQFKIQNSSSPLLPPDSPSRRPDRPAVDELCQGECLAQVDFPAGDVCGPANDTPHHRPVVRVNPCDGYVVYPSWSKDKVWIKLMGCHSHVRRKFFEATEQSPRLVAWILRQLAHRYHIEKRLRETKAGPALREAVRAAESRMIHRRLRKAIDKLALRRSILPKSKLGKAIRYAINQWTNLEVYLGDGRVEICNNLVENAIRPTKLGAKNWMFIGGEQTGWRSAVIYTFVEQVRRHGRDPFAYFEWVFEKLMHNPGPEELEALLPIHWIQTQQSASQTIEVEVA